MTREKILAIHNAEAEAHWAVLDLDRKIEVLNKKRLQAYQDWRNIRDNIRAMKDDVIEPLADSPELVSRVA